MIDWLSIIYGIAMTLIVGGGLLYLLRVKMYHDRENIRRMNHADYFDRSNEVHGESPLREEEEREQA
jgi:hypothetical protein